MASKPKRLFGHRSPGDGRFGDRDGLDTLIMGPG